jgi:hypothetical protein
MPLRGKFDICNSYLQFAFILHFKLSKGFIHLHGMSLFFKKKKTFLRKLRKKNAYGIVLYYSSLWRVSIINTLFIVCSLLQQF